ncbi:thioredoxin domain-containing protein [Natronoglycomyces albus]|uniref:Thioredoxin domain-containing protein n=1 Tax=Natronoglycomyces albus TaxID=2811108 RepID=A0A895XQN6_9ACTN|nr:thioredoxin domain-containing protein [Natronoglycomyces albus]QSB04876.1 thioredoxin domain-containing protein [Natronoglycomyces albus]
MNRLAEAMSPYLQQHANNPVHWWPWSAEALAQAQTRDLPLLISVGYSTCHWCHVMARESFADAEVAAIINENTVPIKVDREERPDVDAIYMQATIALTGQGGWPMTVFALPDGTPFFAGTYFPKPQFMRLLGGVKEAWATKRSELTQQGNIIVEACSSAGPDFADVTVACPLEGPCPPAPPIDEQLLDSAAAELVAAADWEHGGFGHAPKFPTTPALNFLLDHYQRTGSRDSASVVELSLHGMARGGIYDQLAGGFARYSVDEAWVVPHFEKMLYDNAELLALCVRMGSDPIARRVAGETARFLASAFATDEGGFAAAFDADTDGEEGLTYVWTRRQLIEVLGEEDGTWAADLFAVNDHVPSFEHGTSVLRRLTEPDDPARFETVRQRLLEVRDGRPQPHRDDKVVAAWNALAITALTDYAIDQDDLEAAAFADEAAQTAAQLLAQRHMSEDGRLLRVSRAGAVSDAAGVLEDYGAVALAFLARYRSGADEVWLHRASRLIASARQYFSDGEGGFFDTASDAEQLVNRPADPHDGPTPSGWALMAKALLAMYEASQDESYKDDAWRAVKRVEPLIAANPRFTGGLASAAETLLRLQTSS